MPKNTNLTSFEVDDWSRRNIWPLPSGELAVRPGLRTVGSIPAGSELVHAFSVRNDQSDEVHHYITAQNTTTGVVSMYIYDEIYEERFKIAWSNSKPETVTHGEVNGQIVIAAPGLPPLWGFIGHPLYKAKRRLISLSVDLTTEPLPRGICIGWANRVVYAQGGDLYFSDAGDPRARVSLNFLNPTGGVIYGLHVSNEGALIIVTTDGVFRISREGAAAGQIVRGIVDKICNYAAPRYGCTAVVRGRVWGVTRRGVRLVDSSDSYEILMGDPRVRSARGPLVSVADFRPEATLHEGEDGLIMAVNSLDQSAMFDEATQTYSWWASTAPSGFDVVGTLTDEMGRMIVATKLGLVMPLGNYDEDAETIWGSFRGRVKTEPKDSITLRAVHVSSDTTHQVFCVAGSAVKTAAAGQDTDDAVTVGTTADATGAWKSRPVRSRDFDFSDRTDDQTIEVGASVGLARIDSTVTAEFRGPELKRKTN